VRAVSYTRVGDGASTSISESNPSTVAVGIAIFAAIQLGLALFMAVAPHAFYTAVGPFGVFNGHYIRDVASFYGAIGIGLLLSLSRPSWRVPMLAVTTIQYALHSLNHLLDIDKAHPLWNGYFDFFSLAAATVLLAWMWRAAAREATPSAVVPQRRSTVVSERRS
jgi:hypothetical protein